MTENETEYYSLWTSSIELPSKLNEGETVSAEDWNRMIDLMDEVIRVFKESISAC